MKRDPFYQQIIEGLSRPLDPDLFERCAADILRAEWPTLVPVRGGGDAGMDGAVADGGGAAFPLICTTGADVLGNLTRSLTSYLRNGGARRLALVATSQELSPRRRQNLETRAKEKGFTLLQIYTQAAMADRLYRDPAWCRELLNLNGAPSALSVIPPTTRPLLDVPLVGRAGDAAWLREGRGDCLLVGHPGGGKTCLLHHFAKAGGGLFVVGEDRAEITAALRAQHPPALILDDTHVHLDLLAQLRQVREETGLAFSLIACSWPGQQDEVREALNLAPAQVHALDLLTREEILAIIRNVGVFGPDVLLRELLDQSEGRPGLAVTLAHLCRQGGVHEVALGAALSRSIRTSFEPLVGQHATELLAGFAIGGRSGMPMAAVAAAFGLPLVQVRRDVARLAAGGVVRQLPDGSLAVSPEGLRHALVRDVFFQGALSLPVRPFMAQAPDQVEAARTLIGARSRGGDVPDALLRPLLESLDRPHLWGEYAALGSHETAWILSRRPDLIDAVAGPALHFQPGQALARLLDAAVLAEAPRPKPLQLIQGWVRTAEPGAGEAIPRRRGVIRAVRSWLGRIRPPGADPQDTGDRAAEVAVQAVAYALSPQFERTSMDPGLGRTVTIARATLSLAEVQEMPDLWSEALRVLEQVPARHWKAVLEALNDWAYPARHGLDETHPERAQAMHDLARRMVGDLAPLLSGHPGLLTSIRERAERLGVSVACPEDPDFAVLFPCRVDMDWRKEEQENAAAAGALADRWALLEPRSVALRLKGFVDEADLAGLTGPRLTQCLCYELAARVAAPAEWARAFAEAGLSSNLTRPFLVAAVRRQEEGWEALLRRFLVDPKQREAAMLEVLMIPMPPAGLLDEALVLVSEFTKLVQVSCLRNEVPAATVRRLLRHEQSPVATAAAAGLWIAEPRGVIPEELYRDWREAVLRTRSDEYWLGQILSADRALTADWLRARLTEERDAVPDLGGSLYPAVAALDEVVRIGLLPMAPDCFGADELIGCLVGNSPSAFAALLQNPHLKARHLAPLHGANDEQAAWMIARALDAGYEADEVAAALHPTHWSWEGDESLMWQQWADRFDRLAATGDRRIRRALAAARDNLLRSRDQARAQEHAQAVYGHGR